MNSKKIYLSVPLKNGKLLIGLVSALTAVLLTTVPPVQAKEATINTSTLNDTFIRESADTYLNFNDKQGADGLNWVWRHQATLDNMIKCYPSSPSDCTAFRPGQFMSADLSVQYVFSVVPLKGFYDTEKKQTLRFSIKNPNSFVGNHKKTFTFLLPPTILKPGEYAIPTIISLDKWVPPGKGKIEKGMSYRFMSNGLIKPVEIKFFNGQIGTWEGHEFRRHRIHICINKTGFVPKLGDEVTCNPPAKIPAGVAP
jgi:hypothetical protein